MPETQKGRHEHAWTRQQHMDNCCSYVSTYSCRCGASASTTYERDLEADPYSAVWMDPEGREPCERCDELAAGAAPTHTVMIVARDGTVERDETRPIPVEAVGS